jgi:hypothetical protein
MGTLLPQRLVRSPSTTKLSSVVNNFTWRDLIIVQVKSLVPWRGAGNEITNAKLLS